ncbi:MAG: hypothetical protein KHX03_02610 [Clostridium sp.]|nr:hypothetical protein [Clostridium sp.]
MKIINKLCEKLGENNKPIYTVMAIACGKGTVRPILSITDKKEAPDARKYAALRELMTEFIGVPTTFGLGLLGEGLASLLAKKGSVKYKNANSVLSFLGICSAAGYFVPKFCNIGMPPIMKKLMPNYDPNASVPKTSALNKKSASNLLENNIQKRREVNSYVYHVNASSPYFRAGMRV